MDRLRLRWYFKTIKSVRINIISRISKHFDGVKNLRKKLEEAMKVTDDFGRDARSIMRTLENIKDPEQVEKAIKEDVDKIKVLNK